MKTRLLAIPLCLLLGCSSLTPERVQTIATIAGAAVQIGSAVYLAQHPEHKPTFDAVAAALAALLAAGNTNEMAYLERLSTLPVEAFTGPHGDLYVVNASKLNPAAYPGSLVVWDKALAKSVDVRGPAIIPVAKEVRRGLRRALLPMPPVPRPEKGLILVPEGHK